MTSQETVDKDAARVLRPGELCPADVKPLSLARWMFWKSKLEEKCKEDGAGTDERARYAEAIECMALAERKKQ